MISTRKCDCENRDEEINHSLHTVRAIVHAPNEPDDEPANEPAVEPAAEAADEAVPQDVAESGAQAVSEPVTEAIDEHVVEPPAEFVAETVDELVVSESAVEAAVELAEIIASPPPEFANDLQPREKTKQQQRREVKTAWSDASRVSLQPISRSLNPSPVVNVFPEPGSRSLPHSPVHYPAPIEFVLFPPSDPESRSPSPPPVNRSVTFPPVIIPEPRSLPHSPMRFSDLQTPPHTLSSSLPCYTSPPRVHYAPPRPISPRVHYAPPRPISPKVHFAPHRPTSPRVRFAPPSLTSPRVHFVPPRPTSPRVRFAPPSTTSPRVHFAPPSSISPRVRFAPPSLTSPRVHVAPPSPTSPKVHYDPPRSTPPRVHFAPDSPSRARQPFAPTSPVRPRVHFAPINPVRPRVHFAPDSPVRPRVHFAPSSPVLPREHFAPSSPVQPRVHFGPTTPIIDPRSSKETSPEAQTVVRQEPSYTIPSRVPYSPTRLIPEPRPRTDTRSVQTDEVYLKARKVPSIIVPSMVPYSPPPSTSEPRSRSELRSISTEELYSTSRAMASPPMSLSVTCPETCPISYPRSRSEPRFKSSEELHPIARPVPRYPTPPEVPHTPTRPISDPMPCTETTQVPSTLSSDALPVPSPTLNKAGPTTDSDTESMLDPALLDVMYPPPSPIPSTDLPSKSLSVSVDNIFDHLYKTERMTPCYPGSCPHSHPPFRVPDPPVRPRRHHSVTFLLPDPDNAFHEETLATINPSDLQYIRPIPSPRAASPTPPAPPPAQGIIKKPESSRQEKQEEPETWTSRSFCLECHRQEQESLLPASEHPTYPGTSLQVKEPFTITKQGRNYDDIEQRAANAETEYAEQCIPALSRKTTGLTQMKVHFYPEGGWGWIICAIGFIIHLLTTGLQLSFGILFPHIMKRLGHQSTHDIAWIGPFSLAISYLSTPLVIKICRSKTPRKAALFGGLIFTLGCLFTSFASQLHQILISYGLVLGFGAGMVRESNSVMVGLYFKKRREFAELVCHSGVGVGISIISILYKEGVGKLGWPVGLQAVTGLLSLTFFLGVLYRPALLYHPQRRAILHLKNQKKRVRDSANKFIVERQPFLEFSPMSVKEVKALLIATSVASLGLYCPLFYLSILSYQQGMESNTLILLETFLGFAVAVGCVGYGLLLMRPNHHCLISRKFVNIASLMGISIALLALGSIQGHHGYSFFVWLYGLCFGGYFYTLKMLTLEITDHKLFTKTWSYVQAFSAVPLLIGIPVTNYINDLQPKAGFYFSFLATLLGAIIMCYVKPPTLEDPEEMEYGSPETTRRQHVTSQSSPTYCSCSAALAKRPTRHTRIRKSVSFASALDNPDMPLVRYISDDNLPDGESRYDGPRTRETPAPKIQPLRASISVPEDLDKYDTFYYPNLGKKQSEEHLTSSL